MSREAFKGVDSSTIAWRRKETAHGTRGGTTGPYLRLEISKRGIFVHPRECVCVYEGEASPSLFVGRVRVVSKGSARGRGSNWSRIRSKPNFSTRARGPSTVPVSGSQ